MVIPYRVKSYEEKIKRQKKIQQLLLWSLREKKFWYVCQAPAFYSYLRIYLIDKEILDFENGDGN